MTAKYQALRTQIVTALNNAGISSDNIFFRRDDVPGPGHYPAAVVYLDSDQGTNPTKHFNNNLQLNITVALVADINKESDPDVAAMTLKEAFREQYKTIVDQDVTACEYYDARADSSRKVRIAKIKVEYTI